MIKILLLTNISHKKDLLNTGLNYIDEIYLPNFNTEAAFAEREILNDIIIDIFLVLTNSEEAITWMKNKDLKKVLTMLKEKLHEIENLRDRLFVITNYLE
jgi:hypothetical protein